MFRLESHSICVRPPDKWSKESAILVGYSCKKLSDDGYVACVGRLPEGRNLLEDFFLKGNLPKVFRAGGWKKQDLADDLGTFEQIELLRELAEANSAGAYRYELRLKVLIAPGGRRPNIARILEAGATKTSCLLDTLLSYINATRLYNDNILANSPVPEHITNHCLPKLQISESWW